MHAIENVQARYKGKLIVNERKCCDITTPEVDIFFDGLREFVGDRKTTTIIS